jgi:hypothetical protein
MWTVSPRAKGVSSETGDSDNAMRTNWRHEDECVVVAFTHSAAASQLASLSGVNPMKSLSRLSSSPMPPGSIRGSLCSGALNRIVAVNVPVPS